MNPFGLNGPAFLLFYLVLAVAVIAARILLRRTVEGGPTPRVKLTDPYLIAHLRGGRNEALRVAAVSLIDRQLLNVSGAKLTPAASSSLVRRPIEKAMMTFCASGPEASTMFTSPRLLAETDVYQRELEGHGLLPSVGDKIARFALTIGSVALLAFVAGIRIVQALSRGHSNLFFLCLMVVAACGVAAALHGGRRTLRGEAFLGDLKILFESLRQRRVHLKAGGATSELALFAAVWGISSLPERAFPHGSTLFPKATSTSSSTSGSCGSACGSSCGSSCGGGCGGGCGGCGG